MRAGKLDKCDIAEKIKYQAVSDEYNAYMTSRSKSETIKRGRLAKSASW